MENEVRDAVIKLEVKMEQMSDSLATMAKSMATLADIKYEIKDVKADIDVKFQRYLMDYHNVVVQLSEMKKDIHSIAEKQRFLEKNGDKNTWFRENSTKLVWGLVFAGISFIIGIISWKVTGGN